MPDWYIVYSNDGETGVLTVNGEFAETETAARKELAYSLPTAVVVLITQDLSLIPDNLDVIDLEDAEQVMGDPNAIYIPDRKSSH